MIFNEAHIELEAPDRWFIPELGSYVEYAMLTELYWGLEGCYQKAAGAEFDDLEKARSAGVLLEDALTDPKLARQDTTYLAGKLVALNSVLINYAGR